jgi:predicted Rossmann fold nucleotide-binding protein DprA/Smf involved in DNA uptake
MPAMTRPASQVLNLDTVRPAVATADTVTHLSEYPYFVHKWTRQKRRYAPADVSLPEQLFILGRTPRWSFPVIGVGGTRSPTVETFCLVSAVVRELVRSGATIVSGGVPGVDLAAHLAAADEDDGVTVAVLPNPVNLGMRGLEWRSSAVATQIVRRGAFVSEYARACDVGSDEFCERLLARDRIISGLCDLFLAFECNEDSGTVDTARRAVVQGKAVRCVNSVRRSPRQGVEQLVAEFGFPVFDERNFSPREIAEAAMESIVQPTETFSGLSGRIAQ